MYYDHSKRSYYRFPSKNSVTDIDAQMPYFFPDKGPIASEDLPGSFLDSNYNYYENIHSNADARGDILWDQVIKFIKK